MTSSSEVGQSSLIPGTLLRTVTWCTVHLHLIQENYPFLKELKDFLFLQLLVYVILHKDW